MPAHFYDLPDEIILKITDNVPEHRDFLRSLRLVSRRLSRLIGPIVFDVIRIHPCTFPTKQICEDITTELTSGRATVFSYATTRADIQLNRSGIHTEEQIPWLEVVRFLVPTLSNLRSLRWSYNPCDRYSSRFVDHFTSTLGSLPNLQDLSLIFQSNGFRPNFSLEPISELRSISIQWEECTPPTSHIIQEISRLLGRSPGLESFTFSISELYRLENPPSFGDIFSSLISLPPDVCLKLKQIKLAGVLILPADFAVHSRHFKTLEALEMLLSGELLQSASSVAGVCQCLEREQIYLKSFAIESVHPPEVWHYLSSYSGLERLCFYPLHPDDDSTELVDRFFFSVLPCHSHSLKSLEFGTHIPTAWTKLGEEYLDRIKRCISLTDICCWICCLTPTGALTNERVMKWLQAADQLPHLQKLIYHPTLTTAREGIRWKIKMHETGSEDFARRVGEYVYKIVQKLTEEDGRKYQIFGYTRFYG